MRICVVGAGYVGLVSAAGFAEMGNVVECVDSNFTKIASLKNGELTAFEPGLEDLVRRNMDARRLTFTTDLPPAVAPASVVLLAVGTPGTADGSADLTAVDDVARRVAESVAREIILVVKCTVPVGTGARVRRIVGAARHPVHVVSNPEFLKEGDAVSDFLRPDRVIIGCDLEDTFARDCMTRLYHPLCLDRDRVLWMRPESAELAKYAANAMLAIRISFMNEMAALCERVGADIDEVRQGVGSDARIGDKVLHAGPGYGGSCLPKDVRAIVKAASEHGIQLRVADAAHRANEDQKGTILRKLRRHFDGELRGKRIAVWGIAFKPRTDDIRESPALALIEGLLDENAEVVAHDPAALENARSVYGSRIRLCEDAYEAARAADALCLVTEWRQYQSPDFEILRAVMRRPLLIDGRNIWSIYRPGRQGFLYESIGGAEILRA